MHAMNEIAKEMKEINEALYGAGRPNSVFVGGNVGQAMLGRSIEKASLNIKEGMIKHAEAVDNLTKIINKHD